MFSVLGMLDFPVNWLFVFCILDYTGWVWCILGVWWDKPTLPVQDKSSRLRSFGTLQ